MNENEENGMERLEKPTVCIVGQAGPGRSLFVSGPSEGAKLLFVDLHAIGESKEADEVYSDRLSQLALQSGTIIWAWPDDNHSITNDVKALKRILALLPEPQQQEFMSKIRLVPTKADWLELANKTT